MSQLDISARSYQLLYYIQYCMAENMIWDLISRFDDLYTNRKIFSASERLPRAVKLKSIIFLKCNLEAICQVLFL